MNTDNNAGSADSKTVASSASNSNQSVTEKTSSEKFVTVEALLDEKNRRKSLEEKLKAYEEAEKTRKVRDLEEEKNYREILTLKEQEIDSYKQKMSQYKAAVEDGHKLSKVKNELSKFGLDGKYEDVALKLVDRNRLKWDDEMGTVVGAELEAKAIYEKLKDTGIFKKSSGPINQSAPSTINANKSFSQLSKNEKLEIITKAKM